jgi:hypothetical protein
MSGALTATSGLASSVTCEDDLPHSRSRDFADTEEVAGSNLSRPAHNSAGQSVVAASPAALSSFPDAPGATLGPRRTRPGSRTTGPSFAGNFTDDPELRQTDGARQRLALLTGVGLDHAAYVRAEGVHDGGAGQLRIELEHGQEAGMNRWVAAVASSPGSSAPTSARKRTRARCNSLGVSPSPRPASVPTPASATSVSSSFSASSRVATPRSNSSGRPRPPGARRPHRRWHRRRAR